MATFRFPALGLFLIALAVRLLHVWQMRDTLYFSVLMGDARGYDAWAREIAAGDWLGREVFYQAPLYPYFLGTLFSIAGHDLLIARIVQAILGSAACVTLAYAGTRVISHTGGIVAGVMLALYPPAIFFDGLIQKSVLDVFFVCAALAIIATIIERGGTRARWLLLGVVMGALSLTRENALVLAAVVLIWAVGRDHGGSVTGVPSRGFPQRVHGGAVTGVLSQGFRHGGSRGFRHGGSPVFAYAGSRAALLFVAGLALVLLPVVARNYAVGGGVYLTTSQFGSNLYIGNNPQASGSYMALRQGRGSPEFERHDATELAEQAVGRSLSPREVSSYWTDRTIAFITADPWQWLSLLARKGRLLVSATETIDTESQESHAEYSLALRMTSAVWHFGVLLPLAIVGMVALWPEWRRLWILYALTIAYAASVVLFFVVARYRLALVPLLALFAAAGVVRLRGVVRMPARQLAALAAIVVAVIVAASWPAHTVASRMAITENNLGTALQEEGRAGEAIDHYRRALALDPAYTPALNNLGTALRAVGRTDEAVATYGEALARESNRVTVLINLGNARMTQGQFDEALDWFRKAVALDPRSPRAIESLANGLYDYGTIALEAGEMKKAAAALEESLQLRPDSAETHNNLGIALASQGRIADAIPHFNRAVALKPDFAEARDNLRRAREQARR